LRMAQQQLHQLKSRVTRSAKNRDTNHEVINGRNPPPSSLAL
jgi:hypothetical protein